MSWVVQAGILEGSSDGDGGTELRPGARSTAPRWPRWSCARPRRGSSRPPRNAGQTGGSSLGEGAFRGALPSELYLPLGHRGAQNPSPHVSWGDERKIQLRGPRRSLRVWVRGVAPRRAAVRDDALLTCANAAGLAGRPRNRHPRRTQTRRGLRGGPQPVTTPLLPADAPQSGVSLIRPMDGIPATGGEGRLGAPPPPAAMRLGRGRP